MRTLARDKQMLLYSLQGAPTPIYEKNPDGTIRYEEIDGELVPIETGETEITYTKPKKFYASFSMSGSDTTEKVFGIDVSGYDATLIVAKGYVPLTETSLIWFENEPKYLDIEDIIPDPKSADYKVVKVVNSLNFTRFALQRVVKNA